MICHYCVVDILSVRLSDSSIILAILKSWKMARDPPNTSFRRHTPKLLVRHCNPCYLHTYVRELYFGGGLKESFSFANCTSLMRVF